MRFLVIIAALVAPAHLDADDAGYAAFLREEEALQNRFEEGVMHVNGREFLMGDLHEWPLATADFSADFMLRSSIRLRDFLDHDSVLKYHDFEIRRTRDSSFTGKLYFESQMALAPREPQNSEGFYYKLTRDPVFQVEGYDAYYNGRGQLKFFPKASEVTHGFICVLTSHEGAQRGEISLCSVVVVYPYATNIVFTGGRMLPGTFAEYGPNFTAIAERMLEVVTCIDITENEDFLRPTSVSQLLETNPNLSDCDIDVLG